MDLLEDVKRVTSLPSINDTKFFRLRGLSQAAKDRKMNERKTRTPRNIRLIENSDDTDSDDYADSKVRPSFDKYAVRAAIKEVNGGVNFSNKHWEKYWLEHLEYMNKCARDKSGAFSIHNNIKAQTGSIQTDVENLKRKLFKNAAFMGLVNIKKLSLEDLLDINDGNSLGKESKPRCMGSLETTFNDTTANEEGQVDLVPLYEDPEVFVHPLHMGINGEQFKHIDFVVAHVGKKIKETPQQYFVRTADDNIFNFVKK